MPGAGAGDANQTNASANGRLPGSNDETPNEVHCPRNTHHAMTRRGAINGHTRQLQIGHGFGSDRFRFSLGLRKSNFRLKTGRCWRITRD